MGRWLRDHRSWVVAGVAAGVLTASAWFLVLAGLRVATEAALSGVLGVPVHVAAVRPTFAPLRLRVSGVQAGDHDTPVLTAARVYVRADPWALLIGDVRHLRIEVWGPWVNLAPSGSDVVDGLLRRLARGAVGEEGWDLESLRVDETRIEGVDTAPIAVAAFELREVEVSRGAPGAVTLSAELGIMNSIGRLVAEVHSEEGAAAVLVGAEMEGLSLSVLARGEDWRLSGTASGRVWYERSWADAEASDLIGGDVVLRDAYVESDGERIVSFEELDVRNARVDPRLRRVSMGNVEARGGALAPGLLIDALSSPGGGSRERGWALSVDSATLERLRFAPPTSGPQFVVDRLGLDDFASDRGVGWLTLDATYAEGRVRLEVEREESGAPRVARLRLEDVSLKEVLASRLGRVEVTSGVLGADLRLRGPPGILAQGVAEVRDVAAVVRSGGEQLPLFEVDRALAESDYLSFSPLRVRLHRLQIEKPRLWVRHESAGFELSRLLDAVDGQDAPTSPLRVVVRALLDSAGDSVVPESAPSAVGVRLSDGEVHLSDRAVSPPFAMSLGRLNVLVQGPAGTAGYLSLEAAATGGGRSQIRVGGMSSTSGVSMTLQIERARLRDLDGYVYRFVGCEVEGGRLEVGARARLRPDPAAEVRFWLDDVKLRARTDGDALEGLLGAPLPEVLAELQAGGARAELVLGLQGDGAQADYGFADVFRSAFRAAVDEARAGQERRAGPESEELAPELP